MDHTDDDALPFMIILIFNQKRNGFPPIKPHGFLQIKTPGIAFGGFYREERKRD